MPPRYGLHCVDNLLYFRCLLRGAFPANLFAVVLTNQTYNILRLLLMSHSS